MVFNVFSTLNAGKIAVKSVSYFDRRHVAQWMFSKGIYLLLDSPVCVSRYFRVVVRAVFVIIDVFYCFSVFETPGHISLPSPLFCLTDRRGNHLARTSVSEVFYAAVHDTSETKRRKRKKNERSRLVFHRPCP